MGSEIKGVDGRNALDRVDPQSPLFTRVKTLLEERGYTMNLSHGSAAFVRELEEEECRSLSEPRIVIICDANERGGLLMNGYYSYEKTFDESSPTGRLHGSGPKLVQIAQEKVFDEEASESLILRSIVSLELSVLWKLETSSHIGGVTSFARNALLDQFGLAAEAWPPQTGTPFLWPKDLLEDVKGAFSSDDLDQLKDRVVNGRPATDEVRRELRVALLQEVVAKINGSAHLATDLSHALRSA